MYKRIMKAVTV